MSKKLVWLLGLVIVLILGVFVYWMVERPWSKSSSSKAQAGYPVLGDCEKAQFPFACHLDKAMEANNPDLCHDAGMDKRDNCLTAYAEIKNTAVDCSKLQDPVFGLECQQAFKRIQDEAQTAPAVQATSSDMMDTGHQPGLKVDQK